MAARIKQGGGAKPTSDTIIAEALKETSVVDAKGRTIKLVKPNVLAQYKIVRVVGEAAENRVYMSMVMPLLFVSAIDGDPIAFPATERELDALILRLGEEGTNAVMTTVTANWGQVDPEATRDATKK